MINMRNVIPLAECLQLFGRESFEPFPFLFRPRFDPVEDLMLGEDDGLGGFEDETGVEGLDGIGSEYRFGFQV